MPLSEPSTGALGMEHTDYLGLCHKLPKECDGSQQDSIDWKEGEEEAYPGGSHPEKEAGILRWPN